MKVEMKFHIFLVLPFCLLLTIPIRAEDEAATTAASPENAASDTTHEVIADVKVPEGEATQTPESKPDTPQTESKTENETHHEGNETPHDIKTDEGKEKPVVVDGEVKVKTEEKDGTEEHAKNKPVEAEAEAKTEEHKKDKSAEEIKTVAADSASADMHEHLTQEKDKTATNQTEEKPSEMQPHDEKQFMKTLSAMTENKLGETTDSTTPADKKSAEEKEVVGQMTEEPQEVNFVFPTNNPNNEDEFEKMAKLMTTNKDLDEALGKKLASDWMEHGDHNKENEQPNFVFNNQENTTGETSASFKIQPENELTPVEDKKNAKTGDAKTNEDKDIRSALPETNTGVGKVPEPSKDDTESKKDKVESTNETTPKKSKLIDESQESTEEKPSATTTDMQKTNQGNDVLDSKEGADSSKEESNGDNQIQNESENSIGKKKKPKNGKKLSVEKQLPSSANTEDDNILQKVPKDSVREKTEPIKEVKKPKAGENKIQLKKNNSEVKHEGESPNEVKSSSKEAQIQEPEPKELEKTPTLDTKAKDVQLKKNNLELKSEGKLHNEVKSSSKEAQIQEPEPKELEKTPTLDTKAKDVQLKKNNLELKSEGKLHNEVKSNSKEAQIQEPEPKELGKTPTLDSKAKDVQLKKNNPELKSEGKLHNEVKPSLKEAHMEEPKPKELGKTPTLDSKAKDVQLKKNNPELKSEGKLHNEVKPSLKETHMEEPKPKELGKAPTLESKDLTNSKKSKPIAKQTKIDEKSDTNAIPDALTEDEIMKEAVKFDKQPGSKETPQQLELKVPKSTDGKTKPIGKLGKANDLSNAKSQSQLTEEELMKNAMKFEKSSETVSTSDPLAPKLSDLVPKNAAQGNQNKTEDDGTNVNTTLVFVEVVFRHGDRYKGLKPDETYPLDPYAVEDPFWLPYGCDQLRNKGKMRGFWLGQFMRKRYNGFLKDEYYHHDIRVTSADLDRCIDSAQVMTVGLYPPKGINIWNDNVGRFYQPIPVRTLDSEEDIFLNEEIKCVPYERELDKILFEGMRNFNAKYRYVYEYLEMYSGIPVNTLEDVAQIYTTLRIENENGRKLPDWVNLVFPEKLKMLNSYYNQIRASTDYLKIIQAGPLLTLIMDEFKLKATNRLKPNYKIKFWSGFDTTILKLMYTMKESQPSLEVAEELLETDYNGALMIEMHLINKKHYVKALYVNMDSLFAKTKAPRPVKICNGVYLCPLEQFLERMEKYRIYKKEWFKMCNQTYCPINLVEKHNMQYLRR
ncbi:hypothetical protein WDU94_012737 [Cyamophila willieti]